jgi:hypothetical protein
MWDRVVVADEWGDLWDVWEYRTTALGFDVVLGYPHGRPRRGRGSAGGKRVIVTPPLAAFLRANSRRPLAVLGLPVSTYTFVRLRKLLGICRYDGGAWFEERAADLADLPYKAFAAKYAAEREVSPTTAGRWARHFFGQRRRPDGWWKKEPAAGLLLSDQPVSAVAETLGITAPVARQLRKILNVSARDGKNRNSSGTLSQGKRV